MKLTTSSVTTTVRVQAGDMIAFDPSTGSTEGAITLAGNFRFTGDRIEIEGTPIELLKFAEHLWSVAEAYYRMDALSRGEMPSASRLSLNPRYDSKGEW